MGSPAVLGADTALPLWDDEPLEGAFQLEQPEGMLDTAVVQQVSRPWLFGYAPSPGKTNGRGMLILGGGGYVQLMVGREGIQVARWMAGLGFYAFVLVHRFPTAETGPQAPLDDARRAAQLIALSNHAPQGFGICGLSSGGHLAASMLAAYPAPWKTVDILKGVATPLPQVSIIGYGPISTNAAGRTIVANKPALEPPAKQALYDALQPDVQLFGQAPPTFIVYSENDPVVPVVNAHRLADGIRKSGAAVELHIFADAPHGFAMDTKGLPVSAWPALCEAWLTQVGFI